MSSSYQGSIGADGGIGGTYGVMPELYLKIKELMDAGMVKEARDIQNAANIQAGTHPQDFFDYAI